MQSATSFRRYKLTHGGLAGPIPMHLLGPANNADPAAYINDPLASFGVWLHRNSVNFDAISKDWSDSCISSEVHR